MSDASVAWFFVGVLVGWIACKRWGGRRPRLLLRIGKPEEQKKEA